MSQILARRTASTALLSCLLAACGPTGAGEYANAVVPPVEEEHDIRAEFLSKASGDEWVNWPVDLQEGPADERQGCVRVAEPSLAAAIGSLAQQPAIRIDPEEYERLTGTQAPRGQGTLYLLRGFSTAGSEARVTVYGDAVTVHSDGMGGFFSLRRHPCIAALSRSPSAVYTVAVYDL
jgi:hypothetical protein